MAYANPAKYLKKGGNDLLLDRKIALVLMAVFLLFYAVSYMYPPETVSFPRFLLWIFLGLSILLFTFPRKHPDYSLKIVFSREKVVSILLLIAYAVIFPIIGFFTTTFAFAVLYMWIFNHSGIRQYIIVTAIYLIVVYFVFQKWLYVWFPEGLLM
ncbi:MAG: Tripartite tricarboxylate transporter TctB family [Peptococcaceae bacterium]|nr:Tripartite tricarboxylate transporter TctB family [Peptococcaceae bacterium]